MNSHADVCKELVIRTAAIPGLRLFRNNVSAQKFGDRFVKSGLGPGTADYVATYWGLTLWIEVKFGRDKKSKDQRSERQRKFLDAMRDLHCIVLVVDETNVEEVLDDIYAASLLYWRDTAPKLLDFARAKEGNPDDLSDIQKAILRIMGKRDGKASYTQLVHRRREARREVYAIATRLLLEGRYIEWIPSKGGRTLALTAIGRRVLKCMG